MCPKCTASMSSYDSHPALPCFGAQPPMLRQALDGRGNPDINLDPTMSFYRYRETGSGNNIQVPISKGLIRRIIARVPLLITRGSNDNLLPGISLIPDGNGNWTHTDNNGNVIVFQQDRYTKTNKLMWKYFMKYYTYNTTTASKNATEKTNRHTMNCWIPFKNGGGETYFERQQTEFTKGYAYGAETWVNGADIPGSFVPFSGRKYIRIVNNNGSLDTILWWIPTNLLDTFCFPNPDQITTRTSGTLVVDIKALDTLNNNIRPIYNDLTIPFGISRQVIVQLFPNEVWRSMVDTLLSGPNVNGHEFGKSTNFRMGNRSPDNICLYGTEQPILGQDYFPGER